jgi:hypothetical protein
MNRAMKNITSPIALLAAGLLPGETGSHLGFMD